jgi:hypothetical protein
MPYKLNSAKRAYLKNRTVSRREAGRELTTRLKDRPCADCGQRYPHYVMDFDHRDPVAKKFHISRNVHRTLAVLFAETQKCDVVCANCHRARTYHRDKH